MDEKDLFAPPTEMELSEDELFAPPTEVELEEPQDPNEMGVGEAALTGFGQGASFGLTPILSGVVGAGMEAAEDVGDALGVTTDAELEDQGFEVQDDFEGLQGLVDAYYSARDAQKRQEEQAFEDQPVASIGGNIAGGLTSMGGLAKLAGTAAAKALPLAQNVKNLSTAQKAAVAAREGAKAGGLAGFGSGDAKLLEGEVAETLTETGATAAGGALLGGAIPVAGAAARGTASLAGKLPIGKSINVGFDAGKRGINILDDTQIKDFIRNTSDDVRQSISDKFKGASKKQLLEEADALGIKVDAGDSVDEVIESINAGKDNILPSQRGKVDTLLKDLQSISQRENISELSPTQTEEIKSVIGDIAFEGNESGPQKRFAEDLYFRLRDSVEEALGDSSLPERNKKLRSLFQGMERLGIKSKDFFSSDKRVQQEVTDKIQQKIQATPLSTSESKMQDFIGFLSEVDEDLAKAISKESDFVSDIAGFARQSDAEGSVSPKALLGTAQKLIALPGNLAGKGARKISEEKAKALKNLKDLTPEKVDTLTSSLRQQFGETAEPYINQLNKAFNAPGQRKNALLYGIYQQPAFREMLERTGRVMLDEEEQE